MFGGGGMSVPGGGGGGVPVKIKKYKLETLFWTGLHFHHLRGCVYKNQTSSGKLRNIKIPETLAISRSY